MLKIIQTFKINNTLNWLFRAIGDTVVKLGMFYFLTTPLILSFAFTNYLLFWSTVHEAHNLELALGATFRSAFGINQSSTYFILLPVIYTLYSVLMIMVYFFRIFQITVALLLDSFNKTVIRLGSVTDKQDKSEKWNFRQVWGWVTDFRPWLGLSEAHKEYLRRQAIKEA